MDLSPGDKIIAKGKLATVVEIFGSSAVRVLLRSTGEVITVNYSDLELIEVIKEGEEIDGISFGEHSAEALDIASRRYEVIRQWKSSLISSDLAAEALGISKSHLYRLSGKYKPDSGSICLVSSKRGRKSGIGRIPDSVEKIILEATKKKYRTRAASYRKVWQETSVNCRLQGLTPPCEKTVRMRVKKLLGARRRDEIKLGKDASDQKHAARPGKSNIKLPLGLVQMDHTLVDIILLANDRVHVIGRPWITMLIDQYTRVILGYYLSLFVPSAVSVACALANAVLPKKEFVKTVGLSEVDYPFYGLPRVLHMDNATEFISNTLKTGCSVFGVDQKYRPKGKKHYGGHIERSIGTFMTTKVHFLKGSTMSNAVARKGIDSEKNAFMTFSDFSRWFAKEVVIYHSTVHESLGMSPKQAWMASFSGGEDTHPRTVKNAHQFRLYFMPEVVRVISPKGIEFNRKFYWDPILAAHVGTKSVLVKYDPFQMQSIWVKLSGEFYPVGLSDLTDAPLTHEEYRASRFYSGRMRNGDIVDNDGVEAYLGAQAIVDESAKLTKAERRAAAASNVYVARYGVQDAKGGGEDAEKPDYKKVPARFKSEE